MNVLNGFIITHIQFDVKNKIAKMVKMFIYKTTVYIDKKLLIYQLSSVF